MTILFQSIMTCRPRDASPGRRRHGGRAPKKSSPAAAQDGKFKFCQGRRQEWLAFSPHSLTLAIGSIPPAGHASARHLRKNRGPRSPAACSRARLLRFRVRPIYIVVRRTPASIHRSGIALGPGCARDAAHPPAFILGHTPMWIQVLFLRGAAVGDPVDGERGDHRPRLRCATENIIRPHYPGMSDRQFPPHRSHRPRCPSPWPPWYSLRSKADDVRNGAERVTP